MTTQTAELAAPPARRFSYRQFHRLQEIPLGYLLLAPALIILIVFVFFPISYDVGTWLDDRVVRANQISKENAPK